MQLINNTINNSNLHPIPLTLSDSFSEVYAVCLPLIDQAEIQILHQRKINLGKFFEKENRTHFQLNTWFLLCEIYIEDL